MDHGQRSQLHQSPSYAAAAGDFVMSSTVNDTGGGGERFSQWSIHETRDLLMFRADLDPSFMETKRNKILWELISTRMKDKGHNRSPLQCKCKWKNLVIRYNGCETTEESEGMRQQFPFYSEMQTIFATRMQRTMWLEAGGGDASSSKKKAVVHHHFSSDEDDDLENEDISIQGEKKGCGAKRKRKMVMKGRTASSCGGELGNSIVNGVREMMEDFMKYEMEMETQWLKCNEEREEKRRVKEMEWRQTMEALQNERMMIETRWRENEEKRKIREEIRSEKRETLITALLNKLN